MLISKKIFVTRVLICFYAKTKTFAKNICEWLAKRENRECFLLHEFPIIWHSHSITPCYHLYHLQLKLLLHLARSLLRLVINVIMMSSCYHGYRGSQ